MIAMLLTTASNEAGGPSARRASSFVASAYRYSTSPVRTSPLEHALAEVGRENVTARLGHPAGELPVPAGDLEDPISPLDAKQVLNRRLDEVSLPGRPGLHTLVPIHGQPNGLASDTAVGSTIRRTPDRAEGRSFRQLAALPYLPNLCTWPPSRPRKWDIRIIGAVDGCLDLDEILDLKPARDEQPNHVSVADTELDVPDGAVGSVQLESMHAEKVPM